MRKLLLLVAAAASFAVVAVAAPVASADYGNTVQYQAAVSLNCDNKTSFFCTNVVGLGGVWQWFAFSNDGTFDSTETFCAHNDPVFGSGAFHFNGDGSWRPGPVTPEAPPFGQSQDFWVNYNDGQGFQDSGVPYLANKSMHYSFKGGPGISAEAQVSYIPHR
ncbi:MAG TPA: hypothetical protein VF025_11435 [Gaiellaceae bacterium]